MNVFHVLPGAAILTFVLVAPAHADLAEPLPNTGATRVQVAGTTVTAEGWAIADGHTVETIVVSRLTPGKAKAPPAVPSAPAVQTYERWAVDGHKKFERGDRKLGRAWEKSLRSLLAEARTRLKSAREGQAGKKRSKRQGKEKGLLGRLKEGLGARGSRTIGDWVVGWSIGESTARKGGRTSIGRIGIFSFTYALPPVATPRQDPPGTPPAVTPREEKDGHEKKGPMPAPATPKKAKPPTTPGSTTEPPTKRPPWHGWPRHDSPGGASLGASGSVESSADSERGARAHARVVVDLARQAEPPTPAKPGSPPGEVTPRHREGIGMK